MGGEQVVAALALLGLALVVALGILVAWKPMRPAVITILVVGVAAGLFGIQGMEQQDPLVGAFLTSFCIGAVVLGIPTAVAFVVMHRIRLNHHRMQSRNLGNRKQSNGSSGDA